MALSLRSLAAAALTSTLLSLAACAPTGGDLPSEEGTGDVEGAVSGSITVGTTLIATTDVNLRSGPSTSNAVLHVVSKGESVTVVGKDPKNGFYNVDHGGTIGWTHGSYYELGAPPPDDTDPPPAGDFTPEELVAALGSCAQIPGTTKFRKDSGSSKVVPVCALSGAVWWTADLDVDCDGGLGSACKADPYYQSQTAATDSKGKPLDASTLPYVVIPGSSNGFNYKNNGLKMGSVVAVVYNGKISYGILGDVGPMGVIGEASYAMAKELGINPSPISGGVDSGVTYIAFTGASGVVVKKEDHAEAVSIGKARAAALIGK